jgi:3-hydroxybutyryl-CoA dehydratase
MNEYRWEDLAVGMTAEFEATFTEGMVHAFADLSGDINPLHVDTAYAVSKGFPSPVLFGLMTSSLYSKLVGVYLPGKYALLQGIDLDFNAPAFAEQRLFVSGEIVFMSDSVRQIEIKARIRNEDRKLISKAMIRAGLHA